jgi:hypothetical protein
LSSLHLSVCSLDCPAALAALLQLPKLQDLQLNDSSWRQSMTNIHPTGRTVHEPEFAHMLKGLSIGTLPLVDLVRADECRVDLPPVDTDMMTGSAADALAHLTKLTALHAFAPRLCVTQAPGVVSGVTLPSAIGRLTGLRVLWLQCAVDRAGALALSGALRGLVGLAELSLVGTELFASVGARCVAEATGIGETPSARAVADVLAQSLRKLTGLKTLRLDGNRMVSEGGIVEVVLSGVIAPSLEVLSLRHTGVSEEQVHALRLTAIPPKAVVHLDTRVCAVR